MLLTSCVTLGKILNLSEHCQMGVSSFVDSEELKKLEEVSFTHLEGLYSRPLLYLFPPPLLSPLLLPSPLLSLLLLFSTPHDLFHHSVVWILSFFSRGGI